MNSYLDVIPNFADQGPAPTLLSGDEGKRTVELGLLARFLAAIDDSNRLLRGKLQSPPVDSFAESMARIENPALVAVADGAVVGSAIVKDIGAGMPVAEVLAKVKALAQGAHSA